MVGTDYPLSPNQKRLRIALAILCIIGALAGVGGVAVFINRQNLAQVQYPNSELRSQNQINRWFPRATKTDYVFQSDDSFPDIYQWYSRQFGFGPEQEAVGRCVFVATDEPVGGIITNQFTMTMCNTETSGNLIYFSKISRQP